MVMNAGIVDPIKYNALNAHRASRESRGSSLNAEMA